MVCGRRYPAGAGDADAASLVQGVAEPVPLENSIARLNCADVCGREAVRHGQRFGAVTPHESGVLGDKAQRQPYCHIGHVDLHRPE